MDKKIVSLYKQVLKKILYLKEEPVIKKIKILVIFFCMQNILGYDYPKIFKGYFSQKGQDRLLNEIIFKNKKNGTFIEIGAHDGISFSNTYFFEKNLNWSGICIEPNPDIFEKLKQNRICYCEQICISDGVAQKPFLKCSGYMLEMYSGLIDNYNPLHLKRIDDEIAIYGGSKEIIFVNCILLRDLFQKYNIFNVDLLSIDIEGGEESIIKTINFDEVKINIILVENNFNESNIKNFLLSKGYKYLQQIGKDDIYQLKEAYE